MEPITSAILMKSLDGLTARATGIAHNIANAGTLGYQPVRVRFEDALVEAAALGPDAVSQVQPRLELDPHWDGTQNLRLDLEITDAAMTAARYNALVEILNRHIQLSALAISGGR